jgi:hypothetical protein
MLKSSTFFASLAAVLGLSASEQMHINYYYDHGCSSYIGEVDINWASDMTGGSNRYNYHYGTSMSLASCSETYCNVHGVLRFRLSRGLLYRDEWNVRARRLHSVSWGVQLFSVLLLGSLMRVILAEAAPYLMLGRMS